MAQLSFNKTNRLSQAYIISAPSEEERLRQARHIAKAAVCDSHGERPCGVCRHCRKAESGIHPDISGIRRLIDEKTGKPKKDLGVDQIRQMAADASILPNEAAYKVYIIEEAEYMNGSAQNAALKILEEPPAWVIFILCVPGASCLIPTVRSRCAEFNFNSNTDEGSEAAEKAVRGFIKAAASGDRAQMLAWCFSNEAMDTRQAAEFFDCLYQHLADMLCGRKNAEGMNRRRLSALAELCVQCRVYLRLNTGVKHIFGLLAVKAPEAGRNKRIDN